MPHGESAGDRQPIYPRRRVESRVPEEERAASWRRHSSLAEEANLGDSSESDGSFEPDDAPLRSMEGERPRTGSLRLPFGSGTARRRPGSTQARRGLRYGVVAVVCAAGVGAVCYASSPKSSTPIPQRSSHRLPLASRGASVRPAMDCPQQAPAEWLQGLSQLGLLDSLEPHLDAAQEKVFLKAENYCARFGEYPERSNFSGDWTYQKAGMEMTLHGPGGHYDSLVGWSGAPSEAPVTASPSRVHLSWSRAPLERWCSNYCGLSVQFPEKLNRVTLDYLVDQRRGELRFEGIALPGSGARIPEEMWSGLPGTAQWALFRPEQLESILGSASLGRPGNMWAQMLLARREEWVGFGLPAPLDPGGIRAQLALLERGHLPAFLLAAEPSPSGQRGQASEAPGRVGSRSRDLRLSSPGAGLSLYWQGPPPTAVSVQAPAQGEAASSNAPEGPAVEAAGSVLVNWGAKPELTKVDWEAHRETGQVVVSFVTSPAAPARSTAARSGPDLERLHKTRTSVIAGR